MHTENYYIQKIELLKHQCLKYVCLENMYLKEITSYIRSHLANTQNKKQYKLVLYDLKKYADGSISKKEFMSKNDFIRTNPTATACVRVYKQSYQLRNTKSIEKKNWIKLYSKEYPNQTKYSYCDEELPSGLLGENDD